MGYCYTMDDKLCCDGCSSSSGVRKRKCPHGWCPPPAWCPDCWKKAKDTGIWKKGHVGCKEQADKFANERHEEQELLEMGHWLRCSAVSTTKGMVQVSFKNLAGEGLETSMSVELYHAHYHGNVTLETYQEAGNVNILGEQETSTTKQVRLLL